MRQVKQEEGRSSGPSVPANQSVLWAVLSPPVSAGLTGVCFCRAGSQQPRPIPAQGRCWRLLAGRCDPGTRIWWPPASQEKHRSELTARPVLLCPPPPSSPATHRRSPSRRCRSRRSPVGNPSLTAPAGPPSPSLRASRVCQRPARLHGRPPTAPGPASLSGAGGRAAERRSSGRGPGEARECPERVCAPWSRGEPGGAQGQRDSSGVSH